MSSRCYPYVLPQRFKLRFDTEMTKFVVVAAVAMLAIACGPYRVGPGANTSPTPSTGIGFDVTATEKDHAVTMRSGQTLEVVLRATGNMTNWSHPQSNDTSVLVPIVDPAATAARGVTLAAFQAKKTGEVEVTSFAGPLCPTGAMCPMYAVAYSLKVTITQ
jgi:hypothetical protein